LLALFLGLGRQGDGGICNKCASPIKVTRMDPLVKPETEMVVVLCNRTLAGRGENGVYQEELDKSPYGYDETTTFECSQSGKRVDCWYCSWHVYTGEAIKSVRTTKRLPSVELHVVTSGTLAWPRRDSSYCSLHGAVAEWNLHLVLATANVVFGLSS